MIETGTILQNRYRIEKHIGQGGMGKVYVASDERFNSTVAIKETVFEDRNLRKAFEREARLLNSLKHQSLPRVSDHFNEGDGQFLVMEYIVGEDLAEKMERVGAAFPIEDVLNWSKQLCDALDYLHSQDIIHRDIKPQNLKLTPGGQIVLLDFGLAKGNPTDSQHQTAAKSIFGYSRSYASLEQIQGTGTEPRSDLYSLGATLYHLLTGLPPADALTRAMNVLNGKPDPLVPAHLINHYVPVDISKVLQQSMALNANQRPSSARQLQNALENSDLNISEQNVSTFFPVGVNSTADLHSQETKIKSPNTKFTFDSNRSEELINPGALIGAIDKNPYQTQVLSNDSVSKVTEAKPAEEFPIQASRRAGKIAAAAFGGLLLVGTAISAGYFFGSDSTDTNQNKTPAKDNQFVITPPENQTLSDINPTNSEANTADANVLATDNSNTASSQSVAASSDSTQNPKRSVKNSDATKNKTENKNDDKRQTVIIDGERIETDDVIIDENGGIKFKKPPKASGGSVPKYPTNVPVPPFPRNNIFTPLDIERLRQLKELRNRRKNIITPERLPVPLPTP